MPTYIVKPDRDRDFYVSWSTVVDNVTGCGTRSDFIAEPDVTEERMARADANGTSALDPSAYGWDDETFLVHNMPDPPHVGLLPRKLLAQFALLCVEGRDTEAAAFLEPLEDDE